MDKILVLDANQRSALAIIRSLGRRGVKVIAADHRPHPIGAASRYVASSIRYSDPGTSPGAFVQDVVTAADRLDIDIVIPATDLTTMLLASQPDLCNSVRLAAPKAGSYETLTDKAHLFQLAAGLGIPAPVTRVASTLAEALDAAHDVGFPAVLKPARSKYVKGNQVLSTSVEIVRDPYALSASFHNQNWLGDIPCLVQKFVPGHGAGIFALYGPSGPVAWFAHKRIREKPPTGGVSVLSESVPLDPMMQSIASRLLAAADWTGVAMVEFRIASDGTPYLIEVNGRFWGSLQLAIDCGVDFPWLLYQLIQGMPMPKPQSYEVGRRLRWLLGDFDSLIAQLKTTPSDFKHRAGAIAAFARTFADTGCRQEIMRLNDPRPAISEVRQWAQGLFK